MSPGPKKRGHQNKYRKDKAADAKREDVHNLPEVNTDRSLNVSSDQHLKPLDDGTKDETSNFNKYSRRQLVSNWNRYEETPGYENEESRGLDYEVALTCSSGNVSQFRFEAEKEWEDESLQIDTSDFISIDCNALSSALECIPFHKRLGIPEDVFMPEMIEEFCAKANLQSNNYVPPKALPGSCILAHNESMEKSKLQDDISSAIADSLTSCLSIKSEPLSEGRESGLVCRSKKVKEQIDRVTQKKEIDTELDFLLSLSESNEKNYAPMKASTTLQGDSVSTLQPKLFESPIKHSSTDISIDDWLDSIVDDD